MKVDFYVKKYLKGNGEAFDKIYELTKKDVYLSIYIYVKEKDTIEDLMQDVYMKVIDKIDEYEIGTNFHAWISRIARNMTINYCKKKSKMLVLDPIEEDYVFNEEVNDSKLKQYLSYLEDIEKDVFVLRIMLGYKFDSIDDILDLNDHQSYYIFKKLIKELKEHI